MAIDGLSESLVGKKVSVQTNNGATFEGVIYAFDQKQSCLTLFDIGSQSNKARQSFKMFNTSYVTKVTPLDSGSESHLSEYFRKGELPKINTEKIEERARAAREKREGAMGVDVTIEAQDVFDAIERTLKCTWDGQTIVILDVVELRPPYRLDDLKARDDSNNTRSTNTLEHVKKILRDREHRMKQ
eukprot:TRINITY_DN20828_c0_g2_i1.p1 TRINITY_DN20828_c0_g2~~TRINITY_DN20828_c0_g2_i1.p1  ORF type:complete len:186 (+),score=40.27 TRINITY_DN20828_c0_g2_i1:73-630(+)